MAPWDFQVAADLTDDTGQDRISAKAFRLTQFAGIYIRATRIPCCVDQKLRFCAFQLLRQLTAAGIIDGPA